MASTLTLTLVGTSSEPGVAGPKPGVLDAQVSRVGLDLEAFPMGVWGEPASGNDAIPKGDVVFALNRLRFDLRREVGASLLPPIPYRA